MPGMKKSAKNKIDMMRGGGKVNMMRGGGMTMKRGGMAKKKTVKKKTKKKAKKKQLSLGHLFLGVVFFGERCWDRTNDNLLKREALYLTELSALILTTSLNLHLKLLLLN